MPIYEFFCPKCNTIFNFFSHSVNTNKRPNCPRCGKPKLERQVSLFSATGKAKEDTGDADLPIDEARMERAVSELAGEADHINENDPRQAAGLMRRFSEMTGLELNSNMQEAMSRLAAGKIPSRSSRTWARCSMANKTPLFFPRRRALKPSASAGHPPATTPSTNCELPPQRHEDTKNIA